MTSTKPRVLCVDDEANVLSGLRLILRREFDVTICTVPAQALELAADHEFAVVISDMRMPEMNGAEFLARMRQLAPDTTRLLLTGYSELDAAVAAINEGQVFRFLTKPCAPPDLRRICADALRQYQLVTAERELLEKTVRGSINMLSELLSMAKPKAFGRAMRVKRQALQVAEALSHPEAWSVEVAAMLGHVGYLTLPDTLVNKAHDQAPLSAEERELLAGVPAIAERLVESIPRLDGVRAMLHASARRDRSPDLAPDLALGARILEIVDLVDRRLSAGDDNAEAVGAVWADQDELGRRVADCLRAILDVPLQGRRVTVSLDNLVPGMVLVSDLVTEQGILLLNRGSELAQAHIARLLRFPEGHVAEPIEVEVPPSAKRVTA